MKNFFKMFVSGFLFVVGTCPQTFALTATPCGENESNCWSCGADCAARLNETTKELTITGSGTVDNYDWTTPPWHEKNASITSIKVSDGMTELGNNFFFSLSNVTSVSIPDTVTTIKRQVFQGMSSLTSLDIPDSVTSIGDYAFSDTGLTSLTFPSGVTKIGNYDFYRAFDLKEVVIPDGVTEIGSYAFYRTQGLENVVIPDSVTTIKDHAFWGSAVKNIVIPDSVTSIGTEALGGYGDGASGYDGYTNIYCSLSKIESGVCDFSKITDYRGTMFGYEKDGNHYNIYDADGQLVAQYRDMADFGTNHVYVKRRIYTVQEATEALGKNNRNTFSIRYQ